MKYAQLGKSDLIVSRICFGCWQLSPRFWGEVPLEPWHEALKKALDVGVNFLYTADAYGDGYAEESLGTFLAQEGLRDRFMIATKFFWNFQKEERHPDTRYEYILEECEASLRRLRTDRIDLYQMHAFDPLTRPEEVAAAFLQLRKQGKVRWFGVSNQTAEQMRMFQKHFEVTSLQPGYSLLKRDIEQSELPYCLGERVGVIPYSPLYRGLLTGKYKRDHVFTDTRKDNKLYQGKAFHRMLDAMDTLRPLADRHGLTMAQLAIRWVLTHPAVTSAIVGIKTPDHIEGIVAAAEDVLPNDEWHAVANVIDAARAEAEAMD